LISVNEKTTNSTHTEIATLGGGCFWCTEAVFQLIRGVKKVDPGYAGGDLPNPTYEQVSIGRTGHVEVANIIFDPDVISFREILEIFFGTHDPTQRDRQGAVPQHHILPLTGTESYGGEVDC
jgi:peptide-methionine (S)-S-oxide reductase